MQITHLEKSGATGPEWGERRVSVAGAVGWYSSAAQTQRSGRPAEG